MVHLVGFTIEIYYDARPYERQIWENSSLGIQLQPTKSHRNRVKESFKEEMLADYYIPQMNRN